MDHALWLIWYLHIFLLLHRYPFSMISSQKCVKTCMAKRIVQNGFFWHKECMDNVSSTLKNTKKGRFKKSKRFSPTPHVGKNLHWLLHVNIMLIWQCCQGYEKEVFFYYTTYNFGCLTLPSPPLYVTKFPCEFYNFCMERNTDLN